MKKQQTISVRILSEHYDLFEIKCRENRINMSDILRNSVYDFLNGRDQENKVFKYLDWQITISSHFDTKKYIGFATPKKYANIINADNCCFVDEIEKDNNLKENEIDFILADPDDVVIYHLNNIDTEDYLKVFDWIKNEIENKKKYNNAF